MNTELCREKILSQDYMDFISPDYWSGEDIVVRQDQSCILQLGFGYRAVYVDQGLAVELSLERYGYQGIPSCYTLIDTSALNEAGISSVQNYPSLHLRGRDIMIGFIDTGIDYENLIFRNPAGGTRIAGIWDQTVQTGSLPDGFSYGSEYTEDMLNEALRSDNPLAVVPSRDENGHGTFLASVAAGGISTENQFSGAAPEAVIGVVKLKEAKNYLKEFYGIYSDAPCYQENDIMFGLKYLHELAARRRLPIVICIALGTNMGPHNGTSLLSQMVDAYANLLNHCVVIGGGNEASNRHHYYGEVVQGGKADENSRVSCVVIDSRQIEPQGVFVATVGEKVDGHTFIASTFARGAILAVTQKTPEQVEAQSLQKSGQSITQRRQAEEKGEAAGWGCSDLIHPVNVLVKLKADSI